MEKLKACLFYHGEKMGLAVVVVLCLLGLLVAHPWPTAAPQDASLQQELGRLEAKVKTGAPEAQQFAHADSVAELAGQLSPAKDVQPFAVGVWPTVDIVLLPGERQNYPRLASVAQVQVLPERGGLKVTWTVDPQKQAVENAQARYEGVIELMQAVIYRATAEAPNQLQQVGTVPLEDVVIVPPTLGPTGRPGPRRFAAAPLSQPQPVAGLTTVPPGKVAVAEAEQTGRFAYADRAVKADQDYVYKVALVAKNPRYDPANPQGAPELIESALPSALLSLAQRPLPSIRWFFTGGNAARVSVIVYKWHVFSVAASEAAVAGSPGAAAAAPAVTQPGPAAAAATVERGQWVVRNFSVSPGDPIGRHVTDYFAPSGVGKPEQLTIDFSTGCTAVAVDMVLRITAAPQVTLTAAGAPAPSSTRLMKDSLLLYYIDPTGALRTRWQESDLVLAEEQAAPASGGAAPAGARPSTGAPAAAPGGTPQMSAQDRERIGRETQAREEVQRQRREAAMAQDRAAEEARAGRQQEVPY